jgi:polysaccharide export outer membrane protein
VREALPEKVFRNRALPGADGMQVIEPDEISLEVAEYRPVYLTGDIARPGELAFRPGLTVRRAVAIAGGYDPLRTGAAGGLLQLLEAQNKLKVLDAELARQSDRASRLKMALAQQGSNRTSSPGSRASKRGDAELNASKEGNSKLSDTAAEYLARQLRDYENQNAFLKTSSETAEHRIAVLNAQVKNEEEGAARDVSEVERVEGLFKKGLIPITRVTEVRRVSLLSSSRALQTSVALETAKKGP